MMHVRNILSTVEDIMINVGVYLEYRGGVRYREGGRNLLLFEYPHGTEHPHGTHDIPHVHHDTPHGTEYSPQYSR